MAQYKVAQDVEAEDKLLGPFSFRQFIYLIVVAVACALAWGLSRIFIALAIIPLPVILFFGALALPLRKDQPMEVYIAAIVSFYLKPRKRIWVPDGRESLIQITVPKVEEVNRTKDLAQEEVRQRFSYLADIADTGGWSIRHVTPQPQAQVNSAMEPDQYFAAQQTEDLLGDDGSIAHNFDTLISDADVARRQYMVEQMRQAATPPTGQQTIPPQPQNQSSIPPHYSPYPTIHQSVVQPLGNQTAGVQPAPTTQQTPSAPTTPTPAATSAEPVSDDIIGLANNSSLSIQTIQQEANRIRQKEQEADSGEVFISLH
ncbi:PrgI family protein [TM7 phylum sp. oral taxon 349]|nr:PrgI family protein [TM7 phylum sp. oral taxon 349]